MSITPMSATPRYPNTKLMPVVFLPHGGGPMPLLNEPNHRSLTAFLQSLGRELPRPQALLVVTAHWESNEVAISNSARPSMIYDYSGFPPESYQFQYPAAGNPELAQTLYQLFKAANIPVRLDPQRGFDHGTFVPLMLMYPSADIPVLQLSLLHSLDPADHIAIGQVLAPLRAQGVLIVGSGMSFHNMQSFFSRDTHTRERSRRFDDWLTQVVLDTPDYSVQQQHLIAWSQAPEARFCHPREEHLLPLHVCLGAAGEQARAQKNYREAFFNSVISGFIWR
jgi:aromatic ring-opening dioxygenase catalytic subunit (LigB family)